MKRLAAVILAVLLSGVSVYAEDANTGTAQSGTGEYKIEGQLKVRIDADMPTINVTTDVNEVADQYVKTENSVLGVSLEDLKDVKQSLPDSVAAQRPEYYPEYSYIRTGPVLTIKTKSTNKEIDRWSFKITDSTGTAVKSMKGGGNLPQEIVWDGFEENGNVMKVGVPYSYILTYMDKAGIPDSRIGKPKVIDAISYKKDGKLIIEVSSKIFFQKERQDRATEDGNKIMKEIENYIKMANVFPVAIRVYSEDTDMASDQADTLQKMLTEDLVLPAENFKFEKIKDASFPKNYRLVFILTSR